MSTRPETIDEIIGENLRLLTQVLSDVCHRGALAEAGQGKLSTNQFSILRILNRRQELTASGFARILGISASAVTKNLDRLAAIGLIAREDHPSDRRRTTLVLMPDGQRVLDCYDRIASRQCRAILAGFAAEEKTRFLDYIQRTIRETLTDHQDADVICYRCGSRCGDHCAIADHHGSCSLKGTGGN